MTRRICPYCAKVTDSEVVHLQQENTMRGINIKYTAVHWRCNECNEIYDTPKQVDANLLTIRETYQAIVDNMTPAKIKSIREKYYASQKAFGLILGMGELTINSYEQGKSVPTSTNRLLLKLANNPIIFEEMYKLNSFKIGNIQRDRIEASEAFSANSFSIDYENFTQKEKDICEKLSSQFECKLMESDITLNDNKHENQYIELNDETNDFDNLSIDVTLLPA